MNNSEIKQVFTVGYWRVPPAALLTLAEEFDAYLIDIRYKPYSWDQNYTQPNLKKVFQQRYQHFPEWGNLNYKDIAAGIKIVNFEQGVKKIKTLDKPAILMCVCKNLMTCHRYYLAQQLVTRGFIWQEITPQLG